MAGGFKAPGITRIETDLSEVAEAAGTSVGALVGAADKGPTNRRVLITSNKQLVDTFGAPTGTEADMTIYAGLEFLKESNALYFVRASHGDEKYASMEVHPTSSVYAAPVTSGIAAAATSAVLLDDEYTDGNTKRRVDGQGGNYDVEKVTTVSATSSMLIAAQGPGTYGNDVGISIVTCADTDYRGTYGFNWEMNYDDPNATSYVWTSGSKIQTLDGTPSSATDAVWKKVYRVNVYEKPLNTDDSYWPATSATTPVETYLVSNYKIKDAQGNNLYAPDVINSSSKYVYVKVKDDAMPMSTLKTSTGTNPAQAYDLSAINSVISLNGGTDAKASVTESDKANAWYLFTERESSSPNILLVPDRPNSTDTGSGVIGTIKAVGNIAAERQDCIAVGQVGAISETLPQDLVNKVNKYYSFNNPSHVALYTGYDKVNDSFTGQQILLPKAIFGAALMARTDELANTWDAPAGINRGIIGASAGQIKSYSENDIGFMYDNNINASKFIRGIGHVMWGQKTAQRKKSALDRINVRRLLLFLQNTIEPSLLPFLFEPNDEKTRDRVFGVVDGFLSGVFSAGGLTAYEVVVNETNNTPQVIDNNQLNVDIYVQPTRTIEFIQLQTVVTRTGVSFSEV
jgi:phage tail sheath protein FI